MTKNQQNEWDSDREMACIKGWEMERQRQDQDRRNGFCDIFWFPNEFRR